MAESFYRKISLQKHRVLFLEQLSNRIWTCLRLITGFDRLLKFNRKRELSATPRGLWIYEKEPLKSLGRLSRQAISKKLELWAYYTLQLTLTIALWKSLCLRSLGFHQKNNSLKRKEILFSRPFRFSPVKWWIWKDEKGDSQEPGTNREIESEPKEWAEI